MNWAHATKVFEESLVLYTHNIESKTEFDNVAFLSPVEESPSELTLYFCRLSELESLLKDNESYSMIIHADIPFSPDSFQADQLTSCVILAEEADYSKAYRILLQHCVRDRKIEHAFYELVSAMHRKSTMSQIARMISMMYHDAIVFIVNNSLSILASGGPVESNQHLYEDRLRGMMSPSVASKFLPFLRPGFREQPTTDFQTPSSDFQVYHTTIYANSIALGYLIVFVGNDRLLTQKEVSYMNPIAHLLSNGMQRSDYYLGNDTEKTAYLLSTILIGDPFDSLQMESQMRDCGYDLRLYKRLIVFKFDDSTLSGPELFGCGLSYKALFKNSVFVVQKQTIIFLMSYDSDEAPTKNDLKNWKSVLAHNNTKIGVSSSYQDLRQTRIKLEEALSALSTGAAFFPSERVFLFERLRLHHAVYRMLQADERDVAKLYHPGVLKILQHDQGHGTQLARTLYLLLTYPKDIMFVCGALHIHKSTLYSRIEKIRACIPDFDSINTASQIYFTLLLLKHSWQHNFDIDTDMDFEPDFPD